MRFYFAREEAWCKRVAVTYFVAITVAHIPFAHSQAPKDFFDRGYANAPRVDGEQLQGDQSSGSQQSSAGSVSGRHPAGGRPNTNSQGPKVSGPPQQGAAAMRVVLYVSSKDKRHFEAVVRKAFQLAQKNQKIVVSEIYHIGDYRNVSDEITNEAKARKIFIAALPQVPPYLNVESSPAWLLRDAGGEHIVEGFLAIESCVSPEGLYQEPQRALVEEAATPTVGVKAF